MKNRIFLLATLGLLLIPAVAMSQQVTTYYQGSFGSPTTVLYTPSATTTTTVPVTSYYAPTPVRVYSPTYSSSVYTPVYSSSVYTSPQPVIYGRPTYSYYTPYGGTEVRVPGQPIRNAIRAIVP